MKQMITKASYLIVLASLVTPVASFAHGALSYPESRQWICSSGASPNTGTPWGGGNKLICQQIFQNGYAAIATDWSGVARGDAAGHLNKANYQQDPRSAHIAVMGGSSAPICSANSATFAALDDVKNYDWFSNITTISTGPQTFVYAASAPHDTYGRGYVDFYITKAGWDKTKPLTWNDLETKPFCHWTPSSRNSPMQNGTGGRFEDISCVVPANKTGQQVIFAIWQRNDSDEAFYSCSDVNVVASDAPPVVETWQAFFSSTGASSLPSYDSLKVGDVITFTLDDKHTAHHVYQTHIVIDSSNINQWQASLAAQVNHAQSDIAIGILNAQSQLVIPGTTNNNVYAMPARLHDRVWSISLQQHEQPVIDAQWQALKGTNGNAEIQDIQGIGIGDEVVFRLFRHAVDAYGHTSGAQDVDTIRLIITSANLAQWQYALAQKFNTEATERNLIKLGVYNAVTEQVIPSNTQRNSVYLHVDKTHTLNQYTWVIDYHKAQSGLEDTYQSGFAYKAGDVVVLNGNYYECKPWPYTGWCALEAYRPDSRYGDQAWMLLSDKSSADPVVPTPVEPSQPTPPTDQKIWQPDQVYHGGDRVQFNGVVYEAKWWTRGDNPVQNSGAWDVWKKIN